MLTSAEIDSRRIYLTSLSTGGGPLQPDAPHATVNNRRWFRRIDGAPVPTSARRRLHEQILARWRTSNPYVARERSAIVMAGPPGAGKSSTHDQLFRGRDQHRWRELDADVFKRYLLEAALADGTLDEDAGRGAIHVERRERSAEGGDLLLTWAVDSTPVE
ncbi:hypothetical protein ACFWB0_16840 [Rhodococcus sp. NPDC060086]|uniref:hypothetical protein n=1 Tax=Rhodococcus sp. NPDC060086 TaxID=3347055 RepID=UPI00365CC286